MDLVLAAGAMVFMFAFLQVLKPADGGRKILAFQILAAIAFGFIAWGFFAAIVMQ